MCVFYPWTLGAYAWKVHLLVSPSQPPLWNILKDLMSRVCHRPDGRKLLAYLTCFVAKPLNKITLTMIHTCNHPTRSCDLWYLARRIRCPHTTRQVATLKVVKPGEWEPMTCREEMSWWLTWHDLFSVSNDIDWFYPPMKHGNRTSYMYIYIWFSIFLLRPPFV